jgi:LysM repeat protein
LDTLYHLGQVYGIPYTDIQRANCLTSTAIHVGQQLYVPPWAPHTPTPTWFFATDTPFGFLTDTPTDTPFGFWTDTPAETVTTEPSPLTDTAIPPIETPTP